MRFDCELPYTGDNIRCTVEILAADSLAMNELFSERGIIALCTAEDKKYQNWRAHHTPFTQGEAYFWAEPDTHSTLRATIDAHMRRIGAAPAIAGGITF